MPSAGAHRTGDLRAPAGGLTPRTASAMCLIWAGVVPQHPPTIFNQPLSAHSRSCGANDSGVSGNPVGNNGFGRPALGWALIWIGAICDNSSISGRISLGPSAQFIPTLNNGTWEMEFQKASTVCPVTPRLLPAWINVTDAIIGTRRAPDAKACCIAKNAAFAFNVSKMVSTRRRSAPPSRSPRTCSP